MGLLWSSSNSRHGTARKRSKAHVGARVLETHVVSAMDTVIEQQRKLLEERERVEDALVKEKMLKKPNVRSSWRSYSYNSMPARWYDTVRVGGACSRNVVPPTVYLFSASSEVCVDESCVCMANCMFLLHGGTVCCLLWSITDSEGKHIDCHIL